MKHILGLPNGEDTLAGVYTCQPWPDKLERKDRRSCLPEPRRPREEEGMESKREGGTGLSF